MPLMCFGAREGKQQTFALLDEWARMSRDESLAEIARRYFTSHGPATLQDFAWWSGLTMADARDGLEMAKQFLAQEAINGQTYWLASSTPTTKDPSPTAYLLPALARQLYRCESLIRRVTCHQARHYLQYTSDWPRQRG